MGGGFFGVRPAPVPQIDGRRPLPLLWRRRRRRRRPSRRRRQPPGYGGVAKAERGNERKSAAGGHSETCQRQVRGLWARTTGDDGRGR